MPIEERELLSEYGAAVECRNAALFVGAGLSLGAGYPTWGKLISKPQREAGVPDLADMPLVAQYYVDSTPGGRAKLDDHILSELHAVTAVPDQGHALLQRLAVDDIWTTNYDCLLEMAILNARVVYNEGDYASYRSPTTRRITKMHGSIEISLKSWRVPPTITRSDYEDYEYKHPRMWAALRSSYLTKAFLFLGFSFTDPNIEVLLRLSRSLRGAGAPKHFTVIRRPTDAKDLPLHSFRLKDLEASGIAVCEIDNHTQLLPLMRRLEHRTRRPVLMVSGSAAGTSDIKAIGEAIGNRLAETTVDLASLAGPAGITVSFAYGRSLLAEGTYSPARVSFYFRQSTAGAPPLEERIGTAIYTGSTREEIRDSLLNNSRAMIVFGGGHTTTDEVHRARELGLPVIPIAMSGGAAFEAYHGSSIADLLNMPVTDRDERDWGLLQNADVHIVSSAAVRLIRRVMYLDPT